MTAFAGWLLSRRHWLALLAIAFVRLMPPVACALLIADGARHGPARAAPVAAIVLLATLAMTLGGGPFAGMAALTTIGTVVIGFLVGMVLGRGRSLELTFQAAMLGALVLVLILGIVGPSPDVLAAPVIEQFAEFMALIGRSEGQIAIVRSWDPVLLLVLTFFGAMAQIMAAIMLGAWIWSAGEPDRSFAQQFTALRLGRVVGIASIVAVTLSLVLAWPVLQYMVAVAAVGFLLQGLAVAHAWLRAKAWHWSAAAALYVGMFVFGGYVMPALCVVGLLDNFFSLRRPLGPGAS